MIHSLAWIGWLAVSLIALSSTRNPLYLLLVLVNLAIVLRASQQQPSGQQVSLPMFRFTLVIVCTAALFNALTSHYGDTVLFTIPWNIPLLSGQVTLEAVAYGATNGLVLSGIFTAFTILNRVVPVRAFIRMIPRAFYPVALIISIALTFLPSLIRRTGEIKDAQAIRGHQMRNLKDWLPLFLPLLIDSLERALQLAESMTARGFAGKTSSSPSELDRAGIFAGLILFIVGIAGQIIGWSGWTTTLLLVLAAGLVGLVFVAIGRRSKHTTYQVETWTSQAWLVLLGAAITLFFIKAPLPVLHPEFLTYATYPVISLPEFDPLIGLAISGLILPAFLIRSIPDD